MIVWISYLGREHCDGDATKETDIATYYISALLARRIHRRWVCLQRTIRCCPTSRTAGPNAETNRILQKISSTSPTFVRYGLTWMPLRRLGALALMSLPGRYSIYLRSWPLRLLMDFEHRQCDWTRACWHLWSSKPEFDVVHRPGVKQQAAEGLLPLETNGLEDCQVGDDIPILAIE